MPSPSEIKERQEFDDAANNYREWSFTAFELLHAAEVLKKQNLKFKESNPLLNPRPYMGSWTELMLYAFALECLIKSLWVRQGNKLAENGKYKNLINHENHNLLKIAKKVNFPILLNPHLEIILEKLSYIGKNIGRYPIPKKWSETSIFRQRGGSQSVELSWSTEDQLHLEKLINQFKEVVEIPKS